MTTRDPDFSLVIPSYNEARRLPGTIREVVAFVEAGSLDAELVLVDDGSSDATPEVIRRASSEHSFVVPVICPVNGGKGAALRAGVERATGRYVVFCDADLAYPLEDIERLLQRLRLGADVAIGQREGQRRLGLSDPSDYSALRTLATTTFGALVELALRLGVRDTQCGFKAFRRPVARALFGSLTVAGFAFDVELLLLARRWGLRIDRVPVRMTNAEGSSVNVWRDSLRMARDVGRIWWQARRGGYPERPAPLTQAPTRE